MTQISNITIELATGFIALFILTKFIGRRQITPLTPFDFISAIVLGELLGNAIYDPEVGPLYIFYTLSLWALLMYAIRILEHKFISLRGLISGSPSIVIRDGQIDYQELKKNKINISQLQSLLRRKDVFSFKEIEYAILEPNGEITVLNKYQYGSPKREDLNLTDQDVHLPIALISDGQVLWENLKKCGLDKEWLEKELFDKGIYSFQDVIHAEWSEDDGIYVIPFQ